MNVYEIVTDQIIKDLEKGEIPWKRPWRVEQPRNFFTGRPYRGINLLLLGSNTYKSPLWATYHQIQQAGGHVKAGEKSSIAVFWAMLERREQDVVVEGQKRKTGRIPFLRYYRVFNVEQTEGVELPPDEGVKVDPVQAAEDIINKYQNKPTIEEGGERAYYCPAKDEVRIPHSTRFVNSEARYAALFHELTHSTGCEKRLKRYQNDAFGTESYAKEELVAELGASFLSSRTGILTPGIQENTTAYIQNWLTALKNDKRMVVSAASAAQRAVDYMTGELKTYGED